MNMRLIPSAQRSIALGPQRAKRTVSKTRTNAHDGEIIVERGGEVTLRGHMWAQNGIVTVTSPDGLQIIPEDTE
jgi:hypothetical protein